MTPPDAKPTAYVLTDYGAKAAKQVCDVGFPLAQGFDDDETVLLERCYTQGWVRPDELSAGLAESANRLVRAEVLALEELARDASETALRAQLKRRYRTSPVIHVHALMLEYTTECDLRCAHCFKAPLPRITEQHPERLLEAIAAAKRMGVLGFVFNGGEVSRHGQGWLRLVARIHETGHGVMLISNGWWGIDGPVQTSDAVYANADEYAETLAAAGVNRVLFSLDGFKPEHDALRRFPGLFDRVLRAARATRRAGMWPNVSITARPALADLPRFFDFVKREFQLDANLETLLHRKDLLIESGVLLEELCACGRAAVRYEGGRTAPYPLAEPDALVESLRGYCKGITRGIKLSIRANGSVQPCTIGTMHDGFGNIHREPLSTIVNRMRQSPIFRMFDEESFGKYLGYLDQRVFGAGFAERCSLLGALSAIADGVEGLRSAGRLDPKHLRDLNQSVATQMGYWGSSGEGRAER
jgi:MoaA/NifB/PqqE/SkfB family radical SAM enzyme